VNNWCIRGPFGIEEPLHIRITEEINSPGKKDIFSDDYKKNSE